MTPLLGPLLDLSLSFQFRSVHSPGLSSGTGRVTTLRSRYVSYVLEGHVCSFTGGRTTTDYYTSTPEVSDCYFPYLRKFQFRFREHYKEQSRNLDRLDVGYRRGS